MRKIICLTIALALVLGSFSFIFASATSWDTTDAANLQSIKNTLTNTTGSTIYYMISQINGAMRFSNKTLANWLSDIYNQLNNLFQIDDSDVGRRSITYWVREAVLDLDSLVGTGSGTLLYNVSQILSNTNTIKTATQSISNTVTTIGASVTQIETDTAGILINTNTYLPKIYNDSHKTSGDSLGTTEFFSPLGTMQPWTFTYYSSDDLNAKYNRAFSQTLARMYAAQHQGLGSNMGSFNLYSQYANAFSQNYVSTDDILIKSFSNISQTLGTITSGYLNTTKIVNWKTLAESSPVSTGVASMVENYLEAIQNPIARLAYVHASDEEIAARELAADNQAEVVDDFIDPNGAGSVSASSFGSVSDLSSGMTSNLSTDASPTGILDIFNSSHGSWFSQETKNQLDTTANTRKGSETATPLLDQQIEDIYSLIGADKHD